MSLTSPDSRFGGLSGLAAGPGGTLLAVSDRGYFVTLRPRLEQGRLVGIAAADIVALRDSRGRPLPGRRAGDAESIARTADGGVAVGFEQVHRIARFAAPPYATAPTPRETILLPDRARIPGNGGIEAMTVLADGRILMIAEDLRAADGSHRAWLAEAGRFSDLAYVAAPHFDPTDAAPLPNGGALVLERRFNLLGGFGARIVRLRPGAVAPGARLAGEEIARFEVPLTRDNFEGILALPDPDGGFLVYLVSDDNYNSLQRTLLMLFHWPG